MHEDNDEAGRKAMLNLRHALATVGVKNALTEDYKDLRDGKPMAKETLQ